MARDEERLRILRMIEAGQITAEQGLELLKALQEAETAPESSAPSARSLRIRVTDVASGRQRVHVSIPLSLADLGLRISGRFIPGIPEGQLQELLEHLRKGMAGKLVEVVDEEEGERVEITVE